MKYRVQHTTRYIGSEPVSVGHNEAWLTPRSTPTQRCETHILTIVPEPSVRSTRIDYFGNTVAQFSFNQGYDALTVTATGDVEVTEPGLSGADVGWESIARALREHETAADLGAYEFVFDSPRCRGNVEFANYARSSFPSSQGLLAAMDQLIARFHADFRYQSGSTTVSTPVEEVFQQRLGVCQDFAHLVAAMARSLGFAARYVSGYLRTLPPPGQPRLVGADASHAWVSIYAGPLGWVDFDPVLNRRCGTDHITLAWGRDYGDVAPLKGVYVGGGAHELSVSVDVMEVDERRQADADR